MQFINNDGKRLQIAKAIKTFEIEERTISGMRYKITVKFRGEVVDIFTKNTMHEAQQAFRAAGYKPIAWTEGDKIICQTEK